MKEREREREREGEGENKRNPVTNKHTLLTAEWSIGGKGSMTFALSEGIGNPSES